MEKILSISLKLNFTPNTLGCYGLICSYYTWIETIIENIIGFSHVDKWKISQFFKK